MNVTVVLFKKEGTYFSKSKNKDVPYTNFFLRVNAGPLIPVEVKYFKNPQFDNRDPGYQGRVSALSALAMPLKEGVDLPEHIVTTPIQQSLELYKKEGTFHSDTKNKDVPFVNLYLQLNYGDRIPIAVKYFPNEMFDNRDPAYASRMGLISGLANKLPDKAAAEAEPVGYEVTQGEMHEITDDEDIPF